MEDENAVVRVQAEMVRRANLIGQGKKRIYNCKYALSSVVRCGHCGDVFRRIKWNNRGCKSTVWRCVNRVEKGGPHCTARTIKEDVLRAAVVKAVNDVWGARDSAMATIKKNLKIVLGGTNTERLAEVDRLIKEKQTELLNAGSDEEKTTAIGEEIIALREERQELMTDAARIKGLQERMDDLELFLDERPAEITEYSEELVQRLIDKIMVYDDKLAIEFKSGITIEIDV